MPNIEIERKFLVHKDLWGKTIKPAGIHIKQGYLLTDKQKTVRVRTYGENGFITVKGETKGFSRMEFEYTIPLDEAVLMLEKLAGEIIEKVRYKINYENAIWEVDEFSGLNEGLVMAEIELTKEDEKIVLPDWVAGEVTYDERYYNAYLSMHPYKTWQH